MAESKFIKEVFSDYKTTANIKDAKILKLALIKKTNMLAMKIQSNEYIEVKEIWYFENFLMKRFQIENTELIIEYTENVKINSIEEEWKNIICYMAHKYPLMKPLLLMKSDISVKDNVIDVKMHIKGAEFLKAKKTDKELEKIIKNLFGIDYKIELRECINENEVLEYQKRAHEEEEKLVHNTMENLAKQEEKMIEENVPHYESSEEFINAEENGLTLNTDEVTYIMGKPSRAKEKNIKIKDLTANDGRVTLIGRIVTCEAKITKSGKALIVFDLYDGTGMLTCKSFSTPEESGDIVEKIKNAKAIKVTGKAGLDTYEGDITVITNQIVEVDIEVPELPEEDEDTPLILGRNINIKAPLVKVADLGADDGTVSLKGEVIFMEDRELKSGKTLLSFDLYDGSSTMTCKAFLDKNNSKKIIGRIKKAKGITIEGNAQMDSIFWRIDCNGKYNN